jgi:ABC-2 type transport system ATP-binding protein
LSVARPSRRALGVVPQELAFDPFFEVRKVLRLQAGYFGLGREQDAWVDELVAALGLAEKAGAHLGPSSPQVTSPDSY